MKYIHIAVFIFLVLLKAQDTVHVKTDLFGPYKEMPVLGGNLKPSIHAPWNQSDFLEHLSILKPQTLRWPGAEEANYFDWHKGTLMPCYKWTAPSFPYYYNESLEDSVRNYCGYRNDLCNVTDNPQYPRTIQPELMKSDDNPIRTSNYIDNYASNYVNTLQTLRSDNKPLIPFFTLNVLSPEYYDPDSVNFDSNCDLIDPEPVNTISQQLDSIAVLTVGMDEIYIQLGNEPWHNQEYKEGIMSNALSYFTNMIAIARQIDERSDLQHAKVSLFADVHSDDIENDGCTDLSSDYYTDTFRCTWNDSMHVILGNESAYHLFDAYSIHKYTGLKNMQIPTLNENCQPTEPIQWSPLDLYGWDNNLSDCEMSYLIKWMIITRNQLFATFEGSGGYSGLYNSINGSVAPKDIWVTEYDLGLEGTIVENGDTLIDAYERIYSNGWPHALYNLYTTMMYIIETPNIDVLIQNNIEGYLGGYRLIDTYSYISDDGTNNSKYHPYLLSNVEFRPLVSHVFLGLSPKGEAMRLLNEFAWRNDKVAKINFISSEVDSTEIRSYGGTDSDYTKNLYGWAFDKGDFLFMNISDDTLSIMMESDDAICYSYDFTVVGGDLHARNYQTEYDHGLAYDTHPSNQELLWEFDGLSSVPSNVELEQDYFAATYALHSDFGNIKDFTPVFDVPPHCVMQILKDNTFNENACDCDGNVLDCSDVCGGEDDSCLSVEELIIPDHYSISSIYPNPFNPIAIIKYTLPENAHIELMIYDITGRYVNTLINTFQTAGYHSIRWNASAYPSGVYLIRMESGEFIQTQKVVLVK